MLAAPTSRPWQRHVRFGVRGLTVLVGVIGAGLGWLVRGAESSTRPSRRSSKQDLMRALPKLKIEHR